MEDDSFDVGTSLSTLGRCWHPWNKIDEKKSTRRTQERRVKLEEEGGCLLLIQRFGAEKQRRFESPKSLASKHSVKVSRSVGIEHVCVSLAAFILHPFAL